MEKITPVIGYVGVSAFIDYLKHESADMMADTLMADHKDFGTASILEVAVKQAVSQDDELDSKAYELQEYAWILPKSVTRKRWFRIISEGDERAFYDDSEALESAWESVTDAISSAACQVLFNDVPTLYAFHKKLSEGNRANGIRSPRRYIPSWVRRSVYHRDRGKCHWCGRIVAAYDSQTQFDHLIPLADYGVNDVTNIVLSCGKCNRKKSGKTRPARKQDRHW
jgi:hypothetical protein